MTDVTLTEGAPRSMVELELQKIDIEVGLLRERATKLMLDNLAPEGGWRYGHYQDAHMVAVNKLLQQRVVTRDRFEEAKAEVERLRCLLLRDANDAKRALIRVDCRCHAWRACQAIRDRLRGEEVEP